MKTALVTGATSGIGRAAALALGDAGWWVPGAQHDWHDVEQTTLLSVCLVRSG